MENDANQTNSVIPSPQPTSPNLPPTESINQNSQTYSKPQNKIKKIILLISVLVFLAMFIIIILFYIFRVPKNNDSLKTATPPNTKAHESWKEFTNTISGYKLEYPSSYNLIDDILPTIFLTKGTVTFSIHVDYPQNLGLDNPKKENINIDGVPTEKLTYLDNGKVVAATYKFIYLNKAYELNYIKRTEDAKYLALTNVELETMNRIVSSIKFENPTEPDPYDSTENWSSLSTDNLSFKYSPNWPQTGDEKNPLIEVQSPNLTIIPKYGSGLDENHDICWKLKSTEQKNDFYIDYLDIIKNDTCQSSSGSENVPNKLIRVKKYQSKTSPFVDFLYVQNEEKRAKPLIDQVVSTLEFTN